MWESVDRQRFDVNAYLCRTVCSDTDKKSLELIIDWISF